MSKSTAMRRKKDTKSKTTVESIIVKEPSTSDISKYFVKQPDSDETDCTASNVLVPCPDDAALPCSTLSSVTCETTKNCHETNSKSCENSSTTSGKTHTKSSQPVENVSSCKSLSKRKTRKPNQISKNSQITDFFPVRRSNRKTLLSKMSDKNKIIEDAILSGKEEGFEIKVYPDKGRGVIATRAFERGEFVLEYYGELIDYEEAKRRENVYSDKENIGCYMYYFKFKNKQYCIDATKETDRLGRLLNHSKKGNLRTRTFLVKESPHLVLFADRDIQPGEELCYDYGDRRKTALESHPWLAS